MKEVKYEYYYDGSDESFAELISFINRNLHISYFDVFIYADPDKLKPGSVRVYVDRTIDVEDVVK